MAKEFIEKLKGLPHLRLLIILFTVWQYFSVAGMAMLGWNTSLVWLNLGLLLAFIVLCPVFESLLLLILSIPFYVVLPNNFSDSLSMWRIVYIALFLVWLVRDKKLKAREIIFLPWDKYLAGFVVTGIFCAGFFGSFKLQAIKQVLVWVNVYFLYLVTINTLKSKQQIFEIIRYIIWSLAIIITLGFSQLIGTFLTNIDTFWVYWANNVTRLYYGSGFATVSLYSNSWFSYYGGTDLRMFSIMPDSQSFAYICFFALCLGTALTKNVFVHIRKWLWSGIRFAGLAMILSGTRAVWVGMVIPFCAVAQAYYKNFQKHLAHKFLWPFIIIFILFVVSPLMNQGLSYLRVERFKENFLARAQSIYDVKESSNAGRLIMWQNSAEYFLTHPWGVGFNNFLLSFSQDAGLSGYEQAANTHNIRYNLPSKYVSAHSLYLQVLVETGLIGFIFFVMFWLTALKYFWKFIKEYKHTEDFLVYYVAQAALVCLWVLGSAVFDITLLNDKVLMFFLLNIGIAGLIVKRYHEYESGD